MGLFKKYDWWSVDDELQRIIDFYYDGNERESTYWDFYSEQINEMGAIAADMFNEMQGIRDRLSYKYDLPYKKLEFCDDDDAGTHTAISWWNTATCMLSDVDMVALIDGENPMFYGDYEEEKEKRIRMLERLTKKQQMQLYTEVVGFLLRVNELVAAFETITAVIRELDYHQSFVKTKDGLQEPNEAWL